MFELFSHIAPRTCENFIQLCDSWKCPENGEIIGYTVKNDKQKNVIQRVVKGMYLQMGEITRVQEGGCSIYGGEFADESFHVKHTEAGLLGMCKRTGLKHTNESQFYITLGAPLTFLDNHSVVFGRVISGFDCLQRIGLESSYLEESFINEEGNPSDVRLVASG